MLGTIRRSASAVLLSAAVSACANIENAPINLPTHGVPPSASPLPTRGDRSVAIGLALSGGGTRAAAFSFGVLKELGARPVQGQSSLLGSVDLVSGVSGGSITAAYFGYRGEAALADFREKFLIQNVEASLYTNPLDPRNLLRALAGGVNDRRGLQAWLDAHLFHHQTIAALEGADRPLIWINASDIFNNTPFVFDSQTFNTICSDLSALPISEAVAASAAVPIAFAPIVMQSFPADCIYRHPAWVTDALKPDSTASISLQAFARALENYRNPDLMPFIKLLDGGIVDNDGLAGLTLRREQATHPYEPLTPEQAVALRRLLFVVVDAGQSMDDSWVKHASGPDGVDLISAAISTSMNSSKRASYDLFVAQMNAWNHQLIRFRCGLTKTEVSALGVASSGWDCRDLHFFIARVSFSLLDPGEADSLSRLPTTLALKADQVDSLIAGGGEALRRAPAFRDFLDSLHAPEARISLLTPKRSAEYTVH